MYDLLSELQMLVWALHPWAHAKEGYTMCVPYHLRLKRGFGKVL